MLWVLKPFPSISFNDVILGLIEDVCPILPLEIRRIRRLHETDPDLANSELDRLQKEIYEDYTIERLLRRKELKDETKVEQYFKQQEIERNKEK